MRLMLRVVLAFTMLAAVPVGAQEVTVSGGATGRFNADPAFTVGQGCVTLLTGLQYCGSAFNEQTSGGFIAFGGSPNPGSNTNNFGTFYLNNSVVANYNGQTFDLQLTFTSPTGIFPGGQTQTFSSIITGNINSNGNGGVFINFDNNPVAFTFTGSSDAPGMSGVGALMVSDLNVNSGQTASVTGNAQFERITSVPEPSTYVLMAAGLAGLGFMARRRKGLSTFA